MADTFETGLEFRWLRGPFRVRVSIDEEQVGLVPSGWFGWFRGRGPFRSVSVPRADVVSIRRDSWRVRGLRVVTQSGALDHFVIIPDTGRQRDDLHRAFEESGYDNTP